MNQPVTSTFSAYYYVRQVVVFAIYGIWMGLVVNSAMYPDILASPLLMSAHIGICLVLTSSLIYLYYQTCIAITVTDQYLAVEYLLGFKTLYIPYTDIIGLGTYRIKSDRPGRAGPSLKIETINGKVINLNADDYDNYDELKQAIYDYKWPQQV